MLFPTSRLCFPSSLCQWYPLGPVRALHVMQGPLRSRFSPSCASMCSLLLGVAIPVVSSPPTPSCSLQGICTEVSLSCVPEGWAFQCVGRHFIGGWGFITNFSYIGKKRSCFSHWIEEALHHPDALVLIWARSLVTESCSFGGDSCQMEMSF